MAISIMIVVVVWLTQPIGEGLMRRASRWYFADLSARRLVVEIQELKVGAEQVFVNGRPIKLPYREWKLLVKLAYARLYREDGSLELGAPLHNDERVALSCLRSTLRNATGVIWQHLVPRVGWGWYQLALPKEKIILDVAKLCNYSDRDISSLFHV